MAARITVAELSARLIVAENELTNQKYQLAKLTRKSRGTTLANKRVARLEYELVQLRQQLSEQGASSDLVGRLSGLESQIGEFIAEFGTRITMLEEGQESLSERVSVGFSTLNSTLDEHTADITELKKLGVANATAVAEAKTYVTNLGNQLISRFNWVVAAIATFVCFLGLWAWVASDWATPVVSSNGRTIGWAHGVQNENWAFLIVLGCAIVIVVGLGWGTARRGKPATTQSTAQATANAKAEVKTDESLKDTKAMTPVQAKPEPAPTPAKV
ncbi:MAG: hypothetical protein U0491_01145 [Candidatus Saccharimonadales bacterium]